MWHDGGVPAPTHAGFGTVAAQPDIERFWRPARRLVPFAIAQGFIAFAIVFLFALAERRPPSPHPVYGAYEQRFPIVRLVLAIVLAVVAAMLWAVRTHLADTPASGVAAARPGRWTYRGRLAGDGEVRSVLTGSTCIFCDTRDGGQRAFLHTPEIELVDETGSVLVAPEALRLSPKVRVVYADNGNTSECVLRQNEPVTIHGWCGIDPSGRLVLGRHPTVAKRLASNKPWAAWGRYWAAAHGDGRLQLRLLTATAASIALFAALLWVSVFTMQTWVLTGSPSTNERVVLPQHTARLALVAVGVAAAVTLVAWVISAANRVARLRQQAVYAANVVVVTEQQRGDLVRQLASVAGAAAAHAEQTTAALTDGGVAAVVNESADVATGDPAFAHLRAEVVRCENRIAAARAFHADAVTALADRVGPVPGALVSRLTPKGTD